MRTFRVLVNGSEYEVAIEELNGGGSVVHQTHPPPQSTETVAPTRKAANPGPEPASQPVRKEGQGIVIAQMPGTVIEIKVSEGDQVTRGQNLLILEAMKMANEVVAHQDGTVTEIRVSKGASVNAGDPMIILG